MLSSTSLKRYKNLPIILLSIAIGSLSTILITTVFAHGGDPAKIHACVRPTLLNGAPNVRIIGAGANCNNNESPLDWNIQGIQGPPGSGGSSALVCPNCIEGDILARTGYSSLSGSNFDLANLSRGNFVQGEDFSNSSFVKAVLSEVNANNGGGPLSANFTGANFTDASLVAVNFHGVNLTGANLTRANLKFARLSSADMTGAILTDVVWGQTICPDGSDSDSNGNTCIGHLTP